MIPAQFSYQRASTVDEALSLLAEHGEEAKLLAGGQSLLPLMKLRLAAPEVLVDVAPIDELRYVRLDGDDIAIGALSRHQDLNGDPVLAEHAPLLAHVAGSIGDLQIRHRGTIGGSLAHADSAADLPAAILASEGVLVVRGPSGERRIPAADFFLGPFTTPLEPDEMLTEVRVPKQTGLGWGFEKFVRRAIDWAIVGVAVVGKSVGLINMGGTPLRARATEEALASGASPEEAGALAAEGTSPVDEPHASTEYRQHLARVLTTRALTKAAA
ncbi:FAD binding domain-containing protein [Amycolatopsis taiwanensis]|uniref:Carbon-monoxide dehydrogenase medium subunit n=1 Tax=Amycolatopsis taiwanensis TaxID=342230 RepID=A0A9W6QW51_9PSEU|nr:xanthine dehydrogenase family protein subunit M [Amycolatopsis taiwanensis]GLY65164.1 carbon-monoxide dehydrogenase medium subunit [Amycolatopsis taiwanensis]